MKRRRTWVLPLVAVPVIVTIGLATLALGKGDRREGPSRNHDAREKVRRSGDHAPRTHQKSRLQQFKKKKPGLRYRVNPATGATRSLHRDRGALTFPSQTDPVTTATSFLEANTTLLGLDPFDVAEYEVGDIVPSRRSGSTHIHLRQRYAGLRVYNADYHTNLDRDGRITGIANGFMPDVSTSVNALYPQIRASRAVALAAEDLGIPVAGLPRVEERGKNVEETTRIDPTGISSEPIIARLMILPIQARQSRLVWNFQIYTLDHEHWFDMNVDAETGKLWTRYDWVSPDQYRVFAWPAESPNHVQGLPLPPSDGRTLLLDPADLTASPEAWHSSNGTVGNNVRAYQDSNNSNSGSPVDCGPSLICDFSLNLSQAPSQYRPGAIVNLFYWNNLIHDIMYQYGFDELSGNFQENNFGKGGAGSDSVNAEAQDGGGTNNANFATPPDGFNPRMQMYVWTPTNPDRDGDLDNGIIIHEYGHGISNRLVGGPSNSSCLGNEQQPGEGWSDWYALALTAQEGDLGRDPRGIGTYALGQPTNGPGIRTQRYSTDSTVNTWTYESIRSAVVPHGVGSVWAQSLWKVYWALVDKHGFDPNLYNATGGAGNQRALLYVTEGLKNTACSPTFLDARDGVIQAVVDNYPDDECTVWQAFADFGLGVNASTTGSNSSATNNFDIPTQCLCNPQPIADAGPDQTICLGASTTIGTQAFEEHTYNWTPVGGTTAEISVSPTSNTTYSVTATTSCGSTLDSTTIIVDDGSGGGLVEDFENGLGSWTAGGLWHVTDNSTCAAPGYSSPFNALYYGQDGTCHYSTGAANSGNLVSPPISGITAGSTLTFDYYRQVESYPFSTPTGFDWTRVDVSADGGATWNNIWAKSALDESENVWTSSGRIPLAVFAGQTIQVRFNFDTVDNSFNTFTGWFIDDVVVTGESQCIGAGNIAPVAHDQSVVVEEDWSVDITLTGSDGDDDLLTFLPDTGPVNGELTGVAPNLTYTPSANFHGTDNFTFTIHDGAVSSNTAMVSITVNPINDPPVADDQSLPIEEDTAVAFMLAGRDIEGDPLTFLLASGPSNGVLSGIAPNLTYMPNANFNGLDSMTFTVNDGTVNSNTGTVSIEVTAINDSPLADDQILLTAEDTAVAITLSGSDFDGDALNYTVTSGPANGDLSGIGPNLTYTPSTNFHGADSFTYVANDGTTDSGAATVSITVDPTNDPPVANALSITTTESTAVPIILTGSDIDGDTLHFRLASNPSNGVISGTSPNITYTPNANFSGLDSFTVIVNDGIEDSAPALISIIVSRVNVPPVAHDQSVVVEEDSSVGITLTGSDTDNETLTYVILSGPASGTLSGAAPHLMYTPNDNFTATDNFMFTVHDGTENSNTATVTITVTPINDPPVADAQSVVVEEDSSIGITLTGSDIDNESLTYAVLSGPTDGSLSGTVPMLTYLPNANFHGTDSFTFTISDGMEHSNTATVMFTVTPIDDSPVADNLSLSLAEDTPVGISLTGSDIDSPSLTYHVTSGPANGALSGVPPNLIYMPNPHYHGPDNFSYVANDGSMNSDQATVSLLVTSINDVPVADPQSVSLVQDTFLDITLTGSDVEGGLLTYEIMNGPLNGALTGSPPLVTYTSNPGYVGSDTFTFISNDGMADSIAATVSIMVTPAAIPITVTFNSIAAEDGWVRESSENSNVGGRNASTGTGSRALRVGDHRRDRQWRSILSFDTSSIPANATITDASIRVRRGQLRGTNPFGTHGSLQADVVSGAFGGNPSLQNSDFEASATAVGAAALSNPLSNDDFSEGSLTAAGLAAINTEGRTQVRLAFTQQDNDDGSEDSLGFYSSETGNVASRPQLSVTYIP